MENNYIPLEKVIQICQDYCSGKANIDTLNDFGKLISIRTNIPIQDKNTLISLILTQLDYVEGDIATRITQLEVYKFFYILLGGYTNIKVSPSLITFENYDLIMPILKKWVTSYCSEDYENISEMIRESIHVGNLESLIGVLKEIDVSEMEKSNTELKKTIKDLKKNEKIIEDLKYIASFNDPLLNQVVENLKEVAMGDIKNK